MYAPRFAISPNSSKTFRFGNRFVVGELNSSGKTTESESYYSVAGGITNARTIPTTFRYGWSSMDHNNTHKLRGSRRNIDADDDKSVRAYAFIRATGRTTRYTGVRGVEFVFGVFFSPPILMCRTIVVFFPQK